MARLADEDRLVNRGELMIALNVLIEDYPTRKEMVQAINAGLRAHDVRRHRSLWRRLRDWWKARRIAKVARTLETAPLTEATLAQVAEVEYHEARKREREAAASLLVPDTRLVDAHGEPL